MTGIRGSFRFRDAKCIGEYLHSGATPIDYRKDSVVAVSTLVNEMNLYWKHQLKKGDDLTITFGQFFTDFEEHSFAKSAGLVNFCIDVRSNSKKVLEITKKQLLKKIKNIFNINLNIFIRTVLLTFSFLWFTYLGTQIGEDYVAANAILINLVFLSAFILDAYAFSTEGIVGYSLGKKDLNLFKQIIKNSFILSSLSGLVISIIYLFTYDHVINLMSDIKEIRELSTSYVVWLIILPIISSFCYQFDGIFIGTSQTKELRNAMIFSVLIYLIISILLTKFLFNTGIWISLCIFMILRAISLFYYLDKIYLRFRSN